ncbi:hypothetical protein AB0N60_38975 [Streptomyces microflavus]|uniref:hypothetical protein n=1 Tax=Streptomyces microflavus TaxID=1919 RepID=UPI00343F4D27
MIYKSKWAKSVIGIAAATIAISTLSATSSAQAATSCNSSRLCWYQPNGNITNVDVNNVPACRVGGSYPGAIGNDYVRNRHNNWVIDIFYDYNGDGSVTNSEMVAHLWTEDAVTLNPNSRYYYCRV